MSGSRGARRILPGWHCRRVGLSARENPPKDESPRSADRAARTQVHPDKLRAAGGGDAGDEDVGGDEAFVALKAAYDALSDSGKRDMYDKFGKSGLDAMNDTNKLLAEIPISLRRQLCLTLNRKLFTGVPLFKFCDVKCILSLVDRLQPMIFMPGDYIIRQGEIGRALYFICRGRAHVLVQRVATEARCVAPAVPVETASPRGTAHVGA